MRAALAGAATGRGFDGNAIKLGVTRSMTDRRAVAGALNAARPQRSASIDARFDAHGQRFFLVNRNTRCDVDSYRCTMIEYYESLARRVTTYSTTKQKCGIEI